MHDKMSTIFEHSTKAFEEAFSCANRGSTEYRIKLMEIARQNANTTFDLARQACEAKSLPELLELTVAHQRKQFDLVAAQLKELSALTQKVVNGTDRADPPRDRRAAPARELDQLILRFTEDFIIQIHGTGPQGIAYVNPADDPRKSN